MNRKLYRSNDRIIFGICQGIADHFDLSVIWIRLGLVIGTIFTGFFPIPVIYGIAALIIPAAPNEPQKQGPEVSFEEDYFEVGDASSRTLGLRRLKNKFDSIEARIRRMETYVTNKSYDWERRFNSGK